MPLCIYSATLLQKCQMLLATLWQICYWGSESIVNWRPSSKYVIGCQTILAMLWPIPQRALATFANSPYPSEGCQCHLILCKRALITLQSSCKRMLNKQLIVLKLSEVQLQFGSINLYHLYLISTPWNSPLKLFLFTIGDRDSDIFASGPWQEIKRPQEKTEGLPNTRLPEGKYIF